MATTLLAGGGASHCDHFLTKVEVSGSSVVGMKWHQDFSNTIKILSSWIGS
jgi:hypothetical protein